MQNHDFLLLLYAAAYAAKTPTNIIKPEKLNS